MCRVIETLIRKRTFLNELRDLFPQILYNNNVGQINNAIFCCHTGLILEVIYRNFHYSLLDGQNQWHLQIFYTPRCIRLKLNYDNAANV